MNCRLNQNEREELLLGFIAGTLEAERAETYARHVEGCGTCQAELRLQRMLDETLDGWEAPEVSAGFDAALMARIRREREATAWWQPLVDAIVPRGGLRMAWRISVPLALAALALAVLLLRPAEKNPAIPGETLKADEIAEVERTLDDLEALEALHHAEAGGDGKEAL